MLIPSRIAKPLDVVSTRSRPAVLAATVCALVAAVLTCASLGDAQTHRVRRGQTLTRIARRYGVSVDDLQRANGLGRRSRLREGQVLVLPGHEEEARRQRDAGSRRRDRGEVERSWGRPRRAGVATIQSFTSDRRSTLRLVDTRGRVSPATMRNVERLLRYRGGDTKQIHPRLVRLMARVSDHFGGRTLEIISGYRPPGVGPTRHSRHHLGHAVDLRVRGVPNSALRDYCRTFDHVGVGYYPNSSFVHLDVRRTATHWTDWSGPGEHPRYGRHDPSASEPVEAQEPDDLPAEPDDGGPEPAAPEPTTAAPAAGG